MKRLSFITLLLLFSFLYAYNQEDKVTGFWLTGEGQSQVKIFKATNGKYYGKIVWLEEPNEEDGTPKVDDENPDMKLKSRALLDLTILAGFQYDEKKKEWSNGTIYDPESGKTYDCFMWFEGDHDKLIIKGYVLGLRFVGRETQWTREKGKRE